MRIFSTVADTAVLTASSLAGTTEIEEPPVASGEVIPELEEELSLVFSTFISSTPAKALFISFAALTAASALSAVESILAPTLPIEELAFETTLGICRPNAPKITCIFSNKPVTALIAELIIGINNCAIGVTTFPIATVI